MWKVAAADDEAYLRTALKKLMNWEKMGCELIRVVNNGRELLQCVEEEHPDIVITDIRMPEIDGLEVCRQLYEKYPETQTIILSAYTDFEYARTAIRYDVADYVLKLSVLEELPPAVEKVTQKLQKQKKELEEELVRQPEKKDAESLYDQIREYIEKNYDIKSPWNSTDWTWIKFTEEDDIWCGEFRGKYRGVSCSTTLGIIVVLTSDYMYVLDIYGGEIMEYYSQPEYVDITVTPFGKILVTDGYGIEMFANTKISDMENIVLPINADNLKFVEWRENILKISCFEFLTWGKEIELYLNF